MCFRYTNSTYILRENDETLTKTVSHVQTVNFLDVELTILAGGVLDGEHTDSWLDAFDHAKTRLAVVMEFNSVSDVEHFLSFMFLL